MIKQYSRFQPLDLPDQFLGFLMAYEGTHFSELLQLYLASLMIKRDLAQSSNVCTR